MRKSNIKNIRRISLKMSKVRKYLPEYFISSIKLMQKPIKSHSCIDELDYYYFH